MLQRTPSKFRLREAKDRGTASKNSEGIAVSRLSPRKAGGLADYFVSDFFSVISPFFSVALPDFFDSALTELTIIFPSSSV
jgi:hypothetical protein